MKLAICNETYGEWPFARVCEDVAACGYDGIEVATSTLAADPTRFTEAEARVLGEVARSHGLEVVGLHWLLKAPGGMHLTTPDDAVRRRTVEYLEHQARLCAAMGGARGGATGGAIGGATGGATGGVMVLGSPKQRDVLDGDDRDAAFARATKALAQVASTAGGLGVTLALEPLAPAYTNFLTTAAETIRLIEAVDHPACRLHLDAFAMSAESRPIPEIIESGAAHLAHFHANDTSMGGPGTGDLDFVGIFTALRRAGYDGWVSVEVFDFAKGGPAIARESIDCLRHARAAARSSGPATGPAPGA